MSQWSLALGVGIGNAVVTASHLYLALTLHSSYRAEQRGTMPYIWIHPNVQHRLQLSRRGYNALVYLHRSHQKAHNGGPVIGTPPT